MAFIGGSLGMRIDCRTGRVVAVRVVRWHLLFSGSSGLDGVDRPDRRSLYSTSAIRTRPRPAMSHAPVSSCARRHDRVRVRVPVRYGIESADHSGFAESISEGGLYINTNDVLKVGTRLILRIEFPDRTVSQLGEVAWAITVPEHLRDSMVCGMGVSFTHVDPGWLRQLREWQSGAGTGAD
jgi:uncharacterized protein (TIGR02266 family)